MNVQTTRDQIIHTGIEGTFLGSGDVTTLVPACGAHIKILRSGRAVGQPTALSNREVTCLTCAAR